MLFEIKVLRSLMWDLRFFTVVKIQVDFLWVVTPYSIVVGSMNLCNTTWRHNPE
jgi:hypothetical protein